MAANDNSARRWKAVCVYRSEKGPVDVEHLFEEIEELAEIIERGPHWATLISCTITYNLPICADLTLEQAVGL